MDEKRFVKLYEQNEFRGSVSSEIWMDRETRVCYLFHIYGIFRKAGGLTPLLNADGKPVLGPL